MSADTGRYGAYACNFCPQSRQEAFDQAFAKKRSSPMSHLDMNTDKLSSRYPIGKNLTSYLHETTLGLIKHTGTHELGSASLVSSLYVRQPRAGKSV